MRTNPTFLIGGGVLFGSALNTLGLIKSALNLIGLGGIVDDTSTLWRWLMSDYGQFAVLAVGAAFIVYGIFQSQITRWWAKQNHPLLPLDSKCIERTVLIPRGSDEFIVTYDITIINRSDATVRGLEAVLFHPLVGKNGNLFSREGKRTIDLKPGEIVNFEIGCDLPDERPLVELKLVEMRRDEIEKISKHRENKARDYFILSVDGERFKNLMGQFPDHSQSWPVSIQLCSDDLPPVMVSTEIRPGAGDNVVTVVSARKHKWATNA